MRAAVIRHPSTLPWPARDAYLPALLAVVAWEWGSFAAHEFAQALGAPSHAPPGAHAHVPLAIAVAGFLLVRFASFGIEAAAYGGVWRALGSRLPVSRLACWIAGFSLADLLALSLGRHVAAHPGAAAAFAVLLGPSVVWHGQGPLTHAFGGFGALAALRITLTASVQARALGVRLALPLALTLLLWALGRLIVGFGFALLRGPVGVT